MEGWGEKDSCPRIMGSNKGSVKCSFYDTDGTILKEPILNVGDCSITLAGGHTYSILEDDTLVYEYKTGPYKGSENDKIFIDEN